MLLKLKGLQKLLSIGSQANTFHAYRFSNQPMG